MITYANDEEYFYQIQAMIDLDFEDRVVIERVRSTPENDPWYIR